MAEAAPNDDNTTSGYYKRVGGRSRLWVCTLCGLKVTSLKKWSDHFYAAHPELGNGEPSDDQENLDDNSDGQDLGGFYYRLKTRRSRVVWGCGKCGTDYVHLDQWWEHFQATHLDDITLEEVELCPDEGIKSMLRFLLAGNNKPTSPKGESPHISRVV